MPRPPIIVAHRGLSARFPEHTREAYIQALPFADAFECDVRLTRDGELVCWHDGSLQRTSDQAGRVSATAWSTLRAAQPSPLRFVDLLDLAIAEGKSLYVETKHPVRFAGRVERVLHEVLERNAGRIGESGIDVSLMSFAASAVRRFKRMPGESVQLVERARVAIAPWHAQAVGANHTLLTESYVRATRDRGQRVLAWTVNEPAAAVRLARWGVDAIITDCPDMIRAALH